MREIKNKRIKNRFREIVEASQHMGKKFWEVKAAAGDEKIGEILIYGPIFGEKFFDDDVAPSAIREELKALGEIDTLNVYINSPGGDAFAGHAIYNILRRHEAQVHVYVDGLAASAASIIAMAGDKIIMPANSMMMIHNAWTIAIGNADELREVADILDQIGKAMIVVYQEKTGLPEEDIQEMLAAETWMTAEEAVELGFADELEESRQIAASLSGSILNINGQAVDLTRFQNPPKLIHLPEEKEPDPPSDQDEGPPGDEKQKLLNLELELLTGGSF